MPIMKKRRIILSVCSVLLLFLLSGCVNFVQEMQVNQDGSGVLSFALGVETEYYPQVQLAIPEGFQFDNLLSQLIQDENVTDVTQDHYEESGKTYDAIRLEVADVLAVFGEDGRRIGPLTVSLTLEEDVYKFDQVIDLENSNFSIPGINLLDLSGAGYTVRLLVPQIIDTNGRQDAAGECVWEVPLSDLLQGGDTINLNAEFILEPYEGFFIPWEKWFPFILAGFVGVGFLSVLIVIIVNTTGKRKEKRRYRF
jgi:hypothetical protein